LVYIKRIDLRGFKTFGKKVSLSLDRGFTVITGANGSGKSNIVDSVKFTLGELSPKELRGGSLGDLISKTTQTHLRSAYAAIQFENSDRRIPVDSDLVTVSREFVRGGEGVYRINGRRIPRKQVTEILSSAGIEVTGFNIVPQHAITRLAEVTPEERRKIVEDMIGIAVYDAKKAEAQVQLQQADVNLKVASAKVDEVRSRVESLERERNDFLRYRFLKDEFNRSKALMLSSRIKSLQEEASKKREYSEKRRVEAERVRQERDRVSNEKVQIEDEKQRLERETVDQWTARMFEVERTIGERSREIAKSQTETGSSETRLKRVEKEKQDLEKQIDEVVKTVESHKAELLRLREARENLYTVLTEKTTVETEIWKDVQDAARTVDAFNKELQNLEDSINELSCEEAKLGAEIDAGSVKLQLVFGHLKTLESRKIEYERLIEEIEKRSKDLANLRIEEQKQLEEIEKKIRDHAELKESKLGDIRESKEIVERASATTFEFEIQKDVVQTFGAEEKALQSVEELGRAGAIPDVVGRLDRLVKVPEDYRKALETASAGWMKALVVKNVESAVQCIESLKRTRMGRIKIVPLESLSSIPSVNWPEDDPDIIGPIASLVQVEEPLKPAVNFVFGDTVLANSQKAAYMAAVNGVRAVSLSGEVYEPEGGIEGGYYRKPLDIEFLISKTLAVENLERMIKSLETLVTKSEEDVERLQAELDALKENKVHSEGSIVHIDGEMSNVETSLQRAKSTLSNILRRIDELSVEVHNEKNQNVLMGGRRSKIRSRLDELIKRREAARSKVDPAKLSQSQQKHLELSKETSELQRKLSEIDSRIGTLESSIQILEPNLQQMRTRVSELEEEITTLKESIQKERTNVDDSLNQLSQLEVERKSISEELSTVRNTRDEFQTKLKFLESQTKALFEKYEQLNTETNQLSGELKEKEIQASYLLKELQELGYQDVVQADSEEVNEAESTLNLIKRELEEIGAVNQLAVTQYEEQKEIYKQLSTRINELSNEKLTIIDFMNELERKKYDTFMKAFNSVNRNFQEIFSKISNGGSGRLLLENQEDPFKGGMDIYLRFPGKAELTIGSASGGEKSVATVCFILALQSINPMPFYIFDEIDAHLDVLNTQRLADLLRERSRGSQFIVVSLRDITISRADRIYGVYIQEGVSQAVSLPMPEART